MFEDVWILFVDEKAAPENGRYSDIAAKDNNRNLETAESRGGGPENVNGRPAHELLDSRKDWRGKVLERNVFETRSAHTRNELMTDTQL